MNFVQLGRGDAKWAEQAGFRSPISMEFCPVRRGRLSGQKKLASKLKKAVMFVQ